MSDWWGGGDDSGEESDLYSSDEDGGVRGAQGDGPKTRAFTLDDSSSEDEGRRVVKSKKTARFDLVKKSLDVIAAKLKINDWVAISEEWSNLDKAIVKSRTVFESEGVPRFVASSLNALEDAITKTASDKSSKKTMKPQNFKSFTKMKQTYKKFNKADVPGLEAKLAHVRAHPDEESADEQGSDDDGDHDDKGKDKDNSGNKMRMRLPKKGVDAWFTGDDEESGSDLGSGDSDSDSLSGDDEEDVYILGEKRDISYWYTPDKERSSKKKDKREAREKKKHDRAIKNTGDEGTEADAEDEDTDKKDTHKDTHKDKDKKGGSQSTEVDKKEEWTQEKVDKKLKELLSKRGTKSYDRSESQRVLNMLLTKAEGVQNVVAIKFHLLNTHFDAATHARSGTLPLVSWKRAYNALVDLLRTLHALLGSLTLYDTTEDLTRALGDEAADKPLPAHATVGHLVWSVEHLCDAYARLVQHVEAQSVGYVAVLGLERDLLALVQSAQEYFARAHHTPHETALAARQLDLLYYKRASEIDQAPGALVSVSSDLDGDVDVDGDLVTEDGDAPRGSSASVPLSSSSASVSASLSSLTLEEEEEEEEEEESSVSDASRLVLDRPPHACGVTSSDLSRRVSQLSRLVYRQGSEDRSKRRAMMQHVYHLALHDRFYEGRDMLLMSHLADKITRAKPPEQVLYNRLLVQLGLCAFRLGRVKEAHACLAEIAASGRTKELLAQGMANRFGAGASERSGEQEQEERARQVPQHMHMALDHIELAHMTAAMLLEVPNMALARHRAMGAQTRKVVSKAFRRMLDNYERQVFSGPPENTREHVLVCGRLMLLGEWRRARAQLFSLEAWRLVGDAARVQMLLEPQIRDAALRTYVLAALPHYKALSLSTLATMFDLTESAAHATLSRMMGAQELSAAWDQRSAALVPHPHAHVEPTALQALALHFADRAGALLDASEPYDAQQRQPLASNEEGTGAARTQRYGAGRSEGGRRAYVNAPRSDRRVKGSVTRTERNDNATRTRR